MKDRESEFKSDPKMRFHFQHGDHILLEEEHTRASRIQGFCNGVVFSMEPITLEAYYNMTVTGGNDQWSGFLSVGVTNHDPAAMTNVPIYVSPHLTTQFGFWTTFISEEYLKNRSRLTFCIRKDGDMRFTFGGNNEETVLTNLPTKERLWLMIDIYGMTTTVKFNQEDDVPLEIYAKGPEAVHDFNVSMNDGSVPTYRTRLMLIGNDPTARSILKKNFINQHDVAAKTVTIDGIEVSGYHVLDLKPATEMSKSDGIDCQWNDIHDDSVITPKSVMETIFYQILAANITRSLQIEKKTVKIEEFKEQPEVRKKFKSARIERQAVVKRGTTNGVQGVKKRPFQQGQNGTISGSLKEEHFNQYLIDLPDDVRNLVKFLLLDTESKQLMDMEDSEKYLNSTEQTSLESKTTPSSIAYHVWDLNVRRLHYDLLRLVLSPRAIYIVVFDLDSDLDAPSPNCADDESVNMSSGGTPPSQLVEIIFWMNCIHAYATPSVVPQRDKTDFLLPPILIVGTYRRMLSDQDGAVHEKMIEEKFLRIRDCVLDKPFCDHVTRPFFALDISEQPEAESEVAAENTNDRPNPQNEIILQLQNKIRDVVASQPSYGEEMSTNWSRFEDAIVKLRGNGMFHANLTQVQEIARNEGIEMESGQRALLSFYRDIGVLMHFNGVIGTQDWSLTQWVILDPIWLINAFNKILILEQPADESNGIVSEETIKQSFSELTDQQNAPLLEALIKLDLICLKHNYLRGLDVPQLYFMPSKMTSPIPDDWCTEQSPSVTMYFDFLGFLPESLFHQLIVRTIQWTQNYTGRCPILYKKGARFHLDDHVVFLLIMETSSVSYIKVIIVLSNRGTRSQNCIPPYACAKIRNLMESTLADLRELWMKRMSYRTCVCCPCDRICNIHRQKDCRNETCKHFLLLDDCLANNVVLCDYRRVNTSFIRKQFPRTTVPGYNVPVLPENVVMKTVNNETIIMEGMGLVLYQRPTANDAIQLDPRVASGFRTLAKILNGAGEGHNWAALAHSLGYRHSKIDEFREDLNPGLSLITDWIFSSGNTCLSVDMLISCLKQLESHQAIDILQGIQDERDETPVFISYQWDVQDEVVLIRNKLEQYGLDCWMDIGQMGGGDLLYNRVYRGISRSKVVLTCITPKYVISHNCTREISLADLLGKPVIPIMIHPTPWPPPGPLALLFSQMVYIDMCGIGGHGGTGYHADWEDRFQEILIQIDKFVAPIYHKMLVPSQRNPTTTTTVMPTTSLGTSGTNDGLQSSRAASLQNFITLDTASFQGINGHSLESSQTFGDDTSGSNQSPNLINDENRLAEEYRLMMRSAAATTDVDDESGTVALAASEIDSNGDDSDMTAEDQSDSSVINAMQPNVVKCTICHIL